MNHDRAPRPRVPWAVRLAGVLVVVGLALAGVHYATPSTPTARGGAVGSRGVHVGQPQGQGKGESVPGSTKGSPSGNDGGTLPRKGYRFRYGPNHTTRVVLSFDDCPRSLAEEHTVLAGAAQLGIGLMLFPTGNCIRSGHFDAGYARSQGHYVFNHSITHPQLTKLSYAGVLAQLAPPGIQSRYGRPPFGDWNATVARAYAAKGMRIWLWTIDTDDWRGHTEAAVVKTVTQTSRAGDTVLMHMQWNGFSVDALTQMQAGLAKRGLQVCRNFGGTTPVRSWTVRC
ncbi:MAG: polysaccharide deacetylase family protein [Micropruina sp.]|uniref:polysaccharide deacetylase family protein n=1 Tax=Micropruina sp. TaxID=2737536 RepID=UPI0039E4FDB0